jgi:hypothetical protein
MSLEKRYQERRGDDIDFLDLLPEEQERTGDDIDLIPEQEQNQDQMPLNQEEAHTPQLSNFQKFRIMMLASLLRSLAMTYQFQGFKPQYSNSDFKILGKAVTAKKEEVFLLTDLSLKLIIATFFGLPTRLDENKQFTAKQFGRNLIGGWKPVKTDAQGKKLWSEKHRWQYLFIPLKFSIIPAWHLLAIPFRFVFNIVKIFTEFLPLMLEYTFSILTSLSIIAITAEKELLKSQGPSKTTNGTIFGLRLSVILSGLLSFIFSAAHVIGRAFSSPLESYRAAIEYPDFIRKKKIRFANVWAALLSFVLVMLSIGLSITIWTFVLPLSVGLVSTYIPALVEAASWVSQLPVISSFLSTMGNILTYLYTSYTIFTQTLGPAIFGLSTSLGLQLSTIIIVMGSALGNFGTMVGLMMTGIVESISNAWIQYGWDKTTNPRGPLTFLSGKISALWQQTFAKGRVNDQQQHLEEGENHDRSNSRNHPDRGYGPSSTRVSRRATSPIGHLDSASLFIIDQDTELQQEANRAIGNADRAEVAALNPQYQYIPPEYQQVDQEINGAQQRADRFEYNTVNYSGNNNKAI